MSDIETGKPKTSEFGVDTPKLIHIKIGDFWYWKCPICGKLLAKHTIGGVHRGEANMQSKGAASRHLMTHNCNYVNHGRSILEATGYSKKPRRRVTIEEVENEMWKLHQRISNESRYGMGFCDYHIFVYTTSCFDVGTMLLS